MSNVVSVTDASFEAEVLQSESPVVVRFTAVWCGPCKAFAPVFAAAADELVGKVKFVTVDVDESKAIAEKYGVRGIPSVLTLKKGEALGMASGMMAKAKLYEMLAKSFPDSVNT